MIQDTDAIVFRKLWSADADALRGHMLRLDPESRRMRFCAGVGERFVLRYVERMDWSRAEIIGAFVDGALRGVGEMRKDTVFWPDAGEVALTVERPYQNRGVGSALLRRLLVIARNRAIRSVYMVCLAENDKMRRIARKFDSVLTFQPGEVEARITPPWPSHLSLFDEAVDDALAFIRFAIAGAGTTTPEAEAEPTPAA